MVDGHLGLNGLTACQHAEQHPLRKDPDNATIRQLGLEGTYVKGKPRKSLDVEVTHVQLVRAKRSTYSCNKE